MEYTNLYDVENPSMTDQFDMNMQNVYDVKNPSMIDHSDTILLMNSEEKKIQDQIQVIQQAVAAKEIQFVKLQQAM